MNIHLGLGETTSLYCATNTSLSTIDKENIPFNVENISITATSVATTLSAGGVNNINIQLESTRNYVSQMSTQELDYLLIQLDEQEASILSAVDEVSKVKTIGSKKI